MITRNTEQQPDNPYAARTGGTVRRRPSATPSPPPPAPLVASTSSPVRSSACRHRQLAVHQRGSDLISAFFQTVLFPVTVAIRLVCASHEVTTHTLGQPSTSCALNPTFANPFAQALWSASCPYCPTPNSLSCLRFAVHAAFVALNCVAAVGAWRRPRWYMGVGRTTVMVTMRLMVILHMGLNAVCAISQGTFPPKWVATLLDSSNGWAVLAWSSVFAQVPLEVHVPIACVELVVMLLSWVALQPAPVARSAIASSALKLLVFGHVLPTIFTCRCPKWCSGAAVRRTVKRMVSQRSLQPDNSSARNGEVKVKGPKGQQVASAASGSSGGEGAAGGLKPAQQTQESSTHATKAAIQALTGAVLSELGGRQQNQPQGKAVSSGVDAAAQMMLEVHAEVSCRAEAAKQTAAVCMSYRSPLKTTFISMKIPDHGAYDQRGPIMAAVQQSLQQAYGPDVGVGGSSSTPIITMDAVKGCLQLLIRVVQPFLAPPSLATQPQQHESNQDAAGEEPAPSTSTTTTSLTQVSSELQSILQPLQLSSKVLVSDSNGVTIQYDPSSESEQPTAGVTCSPGEQGQEPLPTAVPVIDIQPQVVACGSSESMQLSISLDMLGEDERVVDLLLVYHQSGELCTQRHTVLLPVSRLRVEVPAGLDAGSVDINVLDARPLLEGSLMAFGTVLALPSRAAEELANVLRRASGSADDSTAHQHLLNDLSVAWRVPGIVSLGSAEGSKVLLSYLMQYFMDHDMPHCYASLLHHYLHKSSGAIWKHTIRSPSDGTLSNSSESQPSATADEDKGSSSHTDESTDGSPEQAAAGAAPQGEQHSMKCQLATLPFRMVIAAIRGRWSFACKTPAPSLQPVEAAGEAAVAPEEEVVAAVCTAGGQLAAPTAPTAGAGSRAAAVDKQKQWSEFDAAATAAAGGFLCGDVAPALDDTCQDCKPSSSGRQHHHPHPVHSTRDMLRIGYHHWCHQYSRQSDMLMLLFMVTSAAACSLRMVQYFPPEVRDLAPLYPRRIQLAMLVYSVSVILPAGFLVLGKESLQSKRCGLFIVGNLLAGFSFMLGSKCVLLFPSAIIMKMTARHVPEWLLLMVRALLLHVPWYVQLAGTTIEQSGFLLLSLIEPCKDDPSIYLVRKGLPVQQVVLQRLACVVVSVSTSLIVDWLCWRSYQAACRRALAA